MFWNLQKSAALPVRLLAVLLVLCGILAFARPAIAAGGKSAEKKQFSTGADEETAKVVGEIDAMLRQSWTDNEVVPSPVADDAEWVRRVYLDLVGHIPTLEKTTDFLADKRKNKRATLIDDLLDSPGFIRHWTTIWTNLCIGRGTPQRTSRKGMERFFRDAFTKNRPWNDVVYDLISAEGHFEKNGAVNFLLAQMTMADNGVQATAKTTRLLLGYQVQCTQCHNHPFNKWKQNQFWEFNSFFRQARRIDHRRLDADSGRMVDDYSELVNRQNVEGPVYFEKRSGLMQVAYPIFDGIAVDPGPTTNRREALAKHVTAFERKAVEETGTRPMIADAMVNRLWGHFLGFGFTRPVDDMGPHNSPSHPEILDVLAIEFTLSNFDVKKLVRRICNSQAYGLASQFHPKNKFDNPAIGLMPLFSHAYIKQMSAEQLYDSLVIAAGVSEMDGAKLKDARRAWLQQFVSALGTDENDESTTFNGSIPQALMMMNGPLIERAVSVEPRSFLHGVVTGSSNDSRIIRKLYLTALGRRPIGKEIKAAQRLLRNSSNRLAGYQDLYWALLNSNEFIFVH